MDTKFLALLIEDDESWVRYFQETVEKDEENCFNFHYASSLKESLTMLEKHNYAIILLDLMLPDSQGQNTILSITNKAQYTPIVVLTMLADKKMEAVAYSQGIEDYLIKNEYDKKVFFHVSKAAVHRCISKIQGEFYDDLADLLGQFKSLEETLDKLITK